MLTATAPDHRRKAVALSGRLLSLKETLVLADITEKEKSVRNDITHGVFSSAHIFRFDDSHLCFTWPYVPTLAAVYGNCVLDGAELRKTALDKVLLVASGYDRDHMSCFVSALSEWRNALSGMALSGVIVDVDNYVGIRLGRACENVKPRIDLFADGLERVEETNSVLGGAAVFKNTRISVNHIGKMIERGVPIDEVMDDYSLSRGDVEFAHLYYRARPTRGRPRTKEVADARDSAG